MNKLGMFATGCLAGLVLTVTATKQPLKLLTTSALASSTTSFIACLIVDTRKQSKLNDAEEKVNRLANALAKSQLNVENSEKSLLSLSSEMVKMKEMLSIAKQSLENYQSDSEKSHSQIQELTDKANSLEAQLNACKQELIEKTTSLEEIEEHFDSIVQEEAQKIAKEYEKTRIQEVFDEHDEITSETMRLFRQLQGWGQMVRERHETLKESARELRRQYAKHIDEYTEKVTKEREALLHQIEVLNERIGLLQHELAGDLVEPQYGHFGYQWDARIADDIARDVWSLLHVPLAVKGYQVKQDGSAEAGYVYSRSQSVESLIRDLNRISGDIAKRLGIHKISAIKKHDLSDLLIISWRCEAPVREEEIKRLLTPIDKLVTQVLREMSRKSTIRVMGATGDGKGVCARLLLSRIVKTLDWYVRLHDPQDGSAEDHWGIPKVSTNGREMKASLKAISAQMEEREISKIHTPVTLDILDEIDTQLEKDDKGQFLNLISRIRHLGMKLILIGQNPKVSRAGFQWADMEQMIAFYQGSSALDAIKNNPALELKREMLLKQYEEISTWMQAKNEWLDDAKKHYFGLCVIPGKSPQWYELPIADEIEIAPDAKLLGDTFKIPNSFKGFIETKNFTKTPGNSGKTNSNSRPSADAESLINQGIAGVVGTPDYVGVAGTVGTGGNSGKATCKNHPEGELRTQKDGRYYCPSCKKRLAKSDVEYR